MGSKSQPIASRKLAVSAVEYLLYAWQMEDLVRGAGFDLEKLREFLSTGIQGEDLEIELQWLAGIASEMQESGLEKMGHVSQAEQVLAELVYLHQTLLNLLKDERYTGLYNEAQPIIQELTQKSGGTARNEIEACLNGTYGLLTLRLRKAEVSKETEEGVQKVAALLSDLSMHYRKLRTGEANASLN